MLLVSSFAWELVWGGYGTAAGLVVAEDMTSRDATLGFRVRAKSSQQGKQQQ
jgi:hypothetical protein